MKRCNYLRIQADNQPLKHTKPMYLDKSEQFLIHKKYSNQRQLAFTLAEVLITLAIIGIVAAMTIPTLVANYQKKLTVTKLKNSYSKIIQVINLSQSVNGKDYQGFGLQNCLKNNSNQDAKATCTTFFVDNYIKPNIKIIHDYGITKLINQGYPVYKNLNGEIDSDANYYTGTSNIYLLEISDGVVLQIFAGGIGDSTGYYGIVIGIDLNGKAGPNVNGKDLFFMSYYPESNTLGMLGQRHNRPYTKNEIASICYGGDTISSRWCGGLILLENWEIPDDYPW